MDSPRSSANRLGMWSWFPAAATVVVLVAIAAASVWLRWPGFTQGGFASHDVAGILYNAMVLDAGGLPYIDTIELKAPGTFYLAWAFAGEGGRDISRFQILANAWAVASLLGVAGFAWRAMGPRAAIAAALCYGLVDAHLDSMDANYITWANLPAILAMWLGFEAHRADARGRRSWTWWAAAGLAIGAATLCKRQAGAGLPVLAVWACVSGLRSTTGPRGDRVRAAATNVVVLGAGVVSIHAPIGLHYLVRGGWAGLGALFDGYVFSKWGAAYIARRADVGLSISLREGLLATTYFLALPLAFAAYGATRPKANPDTDHVGFLWAWFGMTLLAAAIGFRFYKGYFLACAAPLSLLAAVPWGALGGVGPLRDRTPVQRGLVLLGRAVLLALALGLAWRQVALLEIQRDDRGHAHDRGGRAIADHIQPSLEPGDTIWVWGWHLWDVYPMTGHLSGSRIYKSLGLLTLPNDDTWRRGAKKLEFREGEYADVLVDELEHSRPRWIVLGSTVPRRDFKRLRRMLRKHYRLDRSKRLGRVQFWKRRAIR